MTPVVFIAGAGRSGSTLLERLLGSQPGWFSVGEVRFFWQYMVEGGHRCGCGEMLESCPFWSAVRGDLEQAGCEFSEVAAIAQRIDRSRHGLWLHALFGDDFEQLRRATGTLYESIARRSGARVLVDSSKAPCHLQLLLAVSAVDLKVLRLVRDGRAVAHAWSRRQKPDPGLSIVGGTMPRRSLARACLAWSWEVALTEVLASEAAANAGLRYEDLVRDPAVELARTLGELGLDLPDNLPQHGQPWTVEMTHSVGGNPIRFDERLTINVRPEAWRQELPSYERGLATLLTVPELLRHGYRIRSNA